MADSLYLLDGMALVYRAHFAFIRSPIFNSKGQNTSAVYGFCNTLMDILQNQDPTHIAVAFDTREPTERHALFPEYKAQREAMPEDIQFALPVIEQFVAAFNIPILKYPGFEADDVIGTLSRKASEQGLETYMVTPDKDFAQLVTDSVRMYKPGRSGSDVEILDVPAVCEKWMVKEPGQVADVLGLWGDASDNIPGVPGVGEKTAKKLIHEYGTMENLYKHTEELKGKLKERIEDNREQALLSKKLTVINTEVPVAESLDDLKRKELDEDATRALMVEFEFNALGKRLFGKDFQSGRGYTAPAGQNDLFASATAPSAAATDPNLKSIADAKHDYRLVDDEQGIANLVKELTAAGLFVFDLETEGLDARLDGIVGIAFSTKAHTGAYVPLPENETEAAKRLDALRPVFEDKNLTKVGHNLKFDITSLVWHGVRVNGHIFDTMLAHYLTEPEQRHNMDILAERYLGYTPISIKTLIGEDKKTQISMRKVPVEQVMPYAVEDADITFQLFELFEPLLKEKGQEKVFYEVEMPLIRVLIDMEREGINLDTQTLAKFSGELERTINDLRAIIFEEADEEFNLNSPKQLGEILFDKLKLVEKPKKTKTGQYATSEQVLQELAPQHQIVQLILDYRQAAKLKSTYVDALPNCVLAQTGRVHTTYSQVGAITGRLASNNPNLQNIPIRSEMGQEIRRAFIPRNDDFTLMAADYSQIELRVMAEMSGDAGMTEAFEAGHDIHTSTAARVFGVKLDEVEPDMRRKAKMVNFGIIYGISAFGLSQRLGIARKEAAEIIEQYFTQYPRVKSFMLETVEFCKKHGYVETLTGRRRYIRDIDSRNGTVKKAAERTAINSPIQGTAADMIKIAMARVQHAIGEAGLDSRMLLTVHDELVFDCHKNEIETLSILVTEHMRSAIKMEIPILVEIGTGKNWLEAH